MGRGAGESSACAALEKPAMATANASAGCSRTGRVLHPLVALNRRRQHRADHRHARRRWILLITHRESAGLALRARGARARRPRGRASLQHGNGSARSIPPARSPRPWRPAGRRDNDARCSTPRAPLAAKGCPSQRLLHARRRGVPRIGDLATVSATSSALTPLPPQPHERARVLDMASIISGGSLVHATASTPRAGGRRCATRAPRSCTTWRHAGMRWKRATGSTCPYCASLRAGVDPRNHAASGAFGLPCWSLAMTNRRGGVHHGPRGAPVAPAASAAPTAFVDTRIVDARADVEVGARRDAGASPGTVRAALLSETSRTSRRPAGWDGGWFTPRRRPPLGRRRIHSSTGERTSSAAAASISASRSRACSPAPGGRWG